MKRTLCACLVVGMFLLAGCTTSQCNVARRTLATAQAGYDRAVASGAVDAQQRYRWTLEAAQAMAAIWCAEVPGEGQ